MFGQGCLSTAKNVINNFTESRIYQRGHAVRVKNGLSRFAKKIAQILSSRDRGWGGGRPKLNCLKNPENERFFYDFKGKYR